MSGDASLSTATVALAPRRTSLFLAATLTAVGLVVAAGAQEAWNAASPTVGHDAPLAMTASGASLRPTAQIVSSDALPHVAGKRITTMVVEFPPSGFSPPHHHGGSVSVFVLAGAIRSQIAGEPPGIYRPGETFFEPLGITHLMAENISATQPARILAVFVADEGATLTTYHQ